MITYARVKMAVAGSSGFLVDTVRFERISFRYQVQKVSMGVPLQKTNIFAQQESGKFSQQLMFTLQIHSEVVQFLHLPKTVQSAGS